MLENLESEKKNLEKEIKEEIEKYPEVETFGKDQPRPSAALLHSSLES